MKTDLEPASPAPPLRRDAERNRQRIINGARVVFANRGLGGAYFDIAAQAEVGVGTVYRRFPDRRQLIDELFEDSIKEVVAIAEEGLAAEDPWEGFVRFIVDLQERQSADRGLRELVFGSDHSTSRLAGTCAQIVSAIDRLIARARDAGVLREDIQTTDIGIMMIAVCTIADATRESAPDVWRRTLNVLLDGLQPVPRTLRPLPVPAMSFDQFDAAIEKSAAVRR